LSLEGAETLVKTAVAPKPISIDCDPGIDDAVSLAMAVASPQLDILGVTTSYGNVGIDNTTTNALRVLEWLGSRTPVFRGVDRALLGHRVDAAAYHGVSGLEAPALGPPTRTAEATGAVQFLIETLLHHTEKVTLVALGPLTNIAMAIRLEPRIVSRIAEIVLMGGSTDYGNDSPAAEFNLLCDPHAAQIVFSSNAHIVMFGLNVTHLIIATPEEMAKIRALEVQSAAVFGDMIAFFETVYVERYGFKGAALHDPCTIAYLLRPDIFTFRTMRVDVETNAGLSFGRTVHDIWGLTGKSKNTLVAVGANPAEFFDLLRSCLRVLR
jgi:purine nucleosidase